MAKTRLNFIKMKLKKAAAEKKRLRKRIETKNKQVSSFVEKARNQTDFAKAKRHQRKADKLKEQADKMIVAFNVAKEKHSKYERSYEKWEELYSEQAKAVKMAKVATKKANAPGATQAVISQAERLNDIAVEATIAIQKATPPPSSPAAEPKAPIKKRKRLTEAERLRK
jgi:hypothetical protein